LVYVLIVATNSRRDRFSKIVCGSEEGEIIYADITNEKVSDDKGTFVAIMPDIQRTMSISQQMFTLDVYQMFKDHHSSKIFISH
jgi:hypothetical protein